MSKYNISYIISTRNRLRFLKITLSNLIMNIQCDEEIVIVDGSSTDGTKEYLLDLFNQGKINQFISEPDRNQAHGWNKAMLMAKGQVIKKIIDDDVFDYNAIRKCKDFMLKNLKTDVVISNDLSVNLNNPSHISKLTRIVQYQNWVKGKQPSFTFGDVHLLIRKSSLAYIGLYNTSFIMMDWEYALRISYLKANITYFTGFNALSVGHEQTVSFNKNLKLIKNQGNKGEIFYEYAGDTLEISNWSKIKIAVGKIINRRSKVNSSIHNEENDLENLYKKFQFELEKINNNSSQQFIHNE